MHVGCDVRAQRRVTEGRRRRLPGGTWARITTNKYLRPVGSLWLVGYVVSAGAARAGPAPPTGPAPPFLLTSAASRASRTGPGPRPRLRRLVGGCARAVAADCRSGVPAGRGELGLLLRGCPDPSVLASAT
jgi:hypothetical protein